MSKPKGSEDADPFGLRPNAPISVVRAAKASLKEPTRPVTPADYGRQLFSTGDPSNRPSTSYSVGNSRSFYQDGGPKLALPRLETGRPDTAAASTLRKQLSGAEREQSRLANCLPGLEATLSPGGPRVTRQVLRLAANLAIWPQAGHALAEEAHVAEALLQLLEAYSFEAAEELVLNTVCALTNLSFYQSEPAAPEGGFSNKVLLLPPARLLPRITPLLMCDNEEAVIEAARVYGNFSRSPDVRDYMQSSRVVEALVLLLDHGNSEVLYSVCGTLINFTMDASRKAVLGALGGGARLVEVLGRTVAQGELGERDEAIVDVVCKALFNIASADDPLVYMNGCLKNISNEPSNQRLLVKLGSLHVVAALLMQLAEQAKSGDDALLESCGQVAVQATGVLRNLAVPQHNAGAFLAAGVVPALRAACCALSTHAEVVLNVGRILSKLSLHDGCQAAMGQDAAYAPLLVQLLGQYADNRAVLLRVAFVLGNLTTASNDYREQVCNVPFALVTVVGILQRYALGGPRSEAGAGGTAAADRLARAASHEDCLVKVLRLAANLAIWPQAGHALAEEAHVAEALLQLLEAYSFEAAEELVLNTVCALTNLSFYQSEPAAPEGGFSNKVLLLPPARLLPRITPLLMCDNEEAVIEAARVYGNFSRSPDVRDYMQSSRVVEALVLLLDHGNSEVLYSVCGTLINFTMDASRKAVLGALGGGARLVEVLGRTVAQGELGERDEAIVDVVCKALFNIASADDAGAGAGAGAGVGAGQQPSASLPAGLGGGAGGSFSRDEVVEVLSLVQVLEASAFAESEEVASVLGRLASQMRRLQQRMSSAELEALPE
ncbi:Armadillo repeat-containing protein 2 [Tetrabaena socialis]|uniref:Armadillo repeat-containing protein 2 n=1 Tax=Tetrabaena socialis TaxID=47790 RepID=A0A2J8AK45_9CHLO|nr:Armadillo repeat-containing protein 2 [Tetrabaena socialis]|eukprot:PNH12894.1 Armadillo repeat-containing protein 2 [Tetrabaena socialis]